SPAGGKNLGPAILGVAQHQRDKFSGRVVRRPGRDGWSRARLLGRRTEPAEHVEDHVRIDAKIPADQADDDDGANAEAAATRHPARCASLAVVFDVAAGTEVVGAHLCHSPSCSLELQAAAQPLSNSPRGNESPLPAKKSHAPRGTKRPTRNGVMRWRYCRR